MASSIINGTVCCNKCGARFPIVNGILNILKWVVLDGESKHEQKIRDDHARRLSEFEKQRNWWENKHHKTEMFPTLQALSVCKKTAILELECGDGRYTCTLAQWCESVLAIDLSAESMRLLRERLKDHRNVGLIVGDITQLKLSAGSFDCALSTLASNLPTQEHRNAMYQLAACALRPSGRFGFSVHHHGFWQRLRREPKSGRYSPGGIYRHNFLSASANQKYNDTLNWLRRGQYEFICRSPRGCDYL